MRIGQTVGLVRSGVSFCRRASLLSGIAFGGGRWPALDPHSRQLHASMGPLGPVVDSR